MSDAWVYALESYSYPFDLRKYNDAPNYSGWFALSSSSGNRAETMQFEDYFRRYALESIEPWLEVVYWKLYNQPLSRNRTTRAIDRRLLSRQVSSRSLWDACNAFVEKPTRQNFESLRKMLVSSNTIAVAATFPAFLRPDLFPMVDRRVARWVARNMREHNSANPAGIQLVEPATQVLLDKDAVLTMRDFTFYERWIRWCYSTSQKLTQRTSQTWRARDVEMAVFTAWGENTRTKESTIHLEPLP